MTHQDDELKLEILDLFSRNGIKHGDLNKLIALIHAREIAAERRGMVNELQDMRKNEYWTAAGHDLVLDAKYIDDRLAELTAQSEQEGSDV